MSALVEVACPTCGRELWARPEDAERPAPCASCRADQRPAPGSYAAAEAERREASMREAIAKAKAARVAAALGELPAPEPDDEPLTEF